MSQIAALGQNARAAATVLAAMGADCKNKALRAMADALVQNAPSILAANAEDLAAARAGGMSEAMLDRLTLTQQRIEAVADGVRTAAALPDPVGQVLQGGVNAAGLHIVKQTVPMGVVGVIFESRPNVTADCAALCFKAGNACILRGGKEAIRSNTAIVRAMRQSLGAAGAPSDAVQLVEDTSRETATAMMKASGVLDLLIPRGGAGLIQSVVQNATVPVIETGIGICHAYVDASADMEMAERIVVNAKTSRPSVCNSIESLLVHQSVAAEFLPRVAGALAEHNVELRACEQALRILGERAVAATEEDFHTEFLDYILAVKVVASLDEAIEHIGRNGSHHSDTIITRDYESSRRFTQSVDSAAVYVNASTRFTDGGEFGQGAEIGISTQKLHARGPMGLEALVSYKYIVTGSGQIR